MYGAADPSSFFLLTFLSSGKNEHIADWKGQKCKIRKHHLHPTSGEDNFGTCCNSYHWHTTNQGRPFWFVWAWICGGPIEAHQILSFWGYAYIPKQLVRKLLFQTCWFWWVGSNDLSQMQKPTGLLGWKLPIRWTKGMKIGCFPFHVSSKLMHYRVHL